MRVCVRALCSKKRIQLNIKTEHYSKIQILLIIRLQDDERLRGSQSTKHILLMLKRTYVDLKIGRFVQIFP